MKSGDVASKIFALPEVHNIIQYLKIDPENLDTKFTPLIQPHFTLDVEFYALMKLARGHYLRSRRANQQAHVVPPSYATPNTTTDQAVEIAWIESYQRIEKVLAGLLDLLDTPFHPTLLREFENPKNPLIFLKQTPNQIFTQGYSPRESIESLRRIRNMYYSNRRANQEVLLPSLTLSAAVNSASMEPYRGCIRLSRMLKIQLYETVEKPVPTIHDRGFSKYSRGSEKQTIVEGIFATAGSGNAASQSLEEQAQDTDMEVELMGRFNLEHSLAAENALLRKQIDELQETNKEKDEQLKSGGLRGERDGEIITESPAVCRQIVRQHAMPAGLYESEDKNYPGVRGCLPGSTPWQSLSCWY
ncbi:MAG: hypothetical protein Q9207_003017 [Kuettlingeria erythrocarpa]